MSGWKKVRNLFWVAETPAAAEEAPAGEELSDADLKEKAESTEIEMIQ